MLSWDGGEEYARLQEGVLSSRLRKEQIHSVLGCHYIHCEAGVQRKRDACTAFLLEKSVLKTSTIQTSMKAIGYRTIASC